jgi:hypothetical protein
MLLPIGFAIGGAVIFNACALRRMRTTLTSAYPLPLGLRRMIGTREPIGVWTTACLVVPAGHAYSR